MPAVGTPSGAAAQRWVCMQWRPLRRVLREARRRMCRQVSVCVPVTHGAAIALRLTCPHRVMPGGGKPRGWRTVCAGGPCGDVSSPVRPVTYAPRDGRGQKLLAARKAAVRSQGRNRSPLSLELLVVKSGASGIQGQRGEMTTAGGEAGTNPDVG